MKVERIMILEKKKYNIPNVEIVLYKTQSLMKIGSDLPDDPGNTTPSPSRRTSVF